MFYARNVKYIIIVTKYGEKFNMVKVKFKCNVCEHTIDEDVKVYDKSGKEIKEVDVDSLKGICPKCEKKADKEAVN
jgi:hypothetical protein